MIPPVQRCRRSGWTVVSVAVLSVAGLGAALPEEAVVQQVIDGDTVRLADGRLVRYIGLDAPEARRRVGPGDREWRAGARPGDSDRRAGARPGAGERRAGVGETWVADPEPLADAATEANRQLVEGKRVRLEYDVQTHDRFGRLLAYVYVGDRMVNEELLAAGYAQLLTIPPNVRHAKRFRAKLEEARRKKRGLWGGERR